MVLAATSLRPSLRVAPVPQTQAEMGNSRSRQFVQLRMNRRPDAAVQLHMHSRQPVVLPLSARLLLFLQGDGHLSVRRDEEFLSERRYEPLAARRGSLALALAVVEWSVTWTCSACLHCYATGLLIQAVRELPKLSEQLEMCAWARHSLPRPSIMQRSCSYSVSLFRRLT